ncbi:MAG: hypothetical protein M3371_02010 [Acidobacteriota bacterium]|nr:hypothetical protein [Acidobacteriota bacterium]
MTCNLIFIFVSSLSCVFSFVYGGEVLREATISEPSVKPIDEQPATQFTKFRNAVSLLIFDDLCHSL